jgi:F-type H+-transporting ATPase subunit delta
MSDLVVAKRYAKALHASAEENGSVEQTGEQLRAVLDVYNQEPDLRVIMTHPGIAADAKLDLIKRAFGDGLSELVISTLKLLIERGRFPVLPAMYQAYTAIADERSGRARAIVYSAYELSEADSQAIAAQFSRLTGKTIAVENVIDKSLIGGIRVRIGDRLYEGSVAGKLEQLRKQLKQNA